MLVGRVDFGESSQARSASYSAVEEAMARSIVRLECEADELRAEVAMLREERNILARAKAAVTEGAEPSCNDASQAFRERPEPSPHLSDTPDAYERMEALLCETQGLRDELAELKRERDEARKAFAIATANCVDVQQRLRVLERERDETQADREHLITISRYRLEKIRQLEREIEAHRPPTSSNLKISNHEPTT